MASPATRERRNVDYPLNAYSRLQEACYQMLGWGKSGVTVNQSMKCGVGQKYQRSRLPGPTSEWLGRIGVYDRIGFNLNKPIGINKPRYLNDRACRAEVSKEFTMYLGYFLPVIDVRQEYSGSNDIR